MSIHIQTNDDVLSVAGLDTPRLRRFIKPYGWYTLVANKGTKQKGHKTAVTYKAIFWAYTCICNKEVPLQ